MEVTWVSVVVHIHAPGEAKAEAQVRTAGELAGAKDLGEPDGRNTMLIPGLYFHQKSLTDQDILANI